MKKIDFYEQGDIVKVVNKGERYCTYSKLFDFYGYNEERFYNENHRLFKELKENHLYKVLKQVAHQREKNTQILFIQDKSGYIYAIRIEGVELYKEELLWA